MEWSFIQYSFDDFNVGKNCINMVKHFKLDQFHVFVQNGYFSKPIYLQRGC